MTRTEITNDPARIAAQPAMVSVNTALQVDLSDQAGASHIDGRLYSGFGFSRATPQDRTGAGAADAVAYWLAGAGIYFTFGLLFYYSAKEKLFDTSGTMPAGLAKTFQGTFVASFTGANTSWVLIGILEAIVLVLLMPPYRKAHWLSGVRDDEPAESR
jgi:Acetyl-CoA hydrolase/transferase C-terminal domain